MAAGKAEKSHLENKVDQELDEIFGNLGPEVTTVKLYRLEAGKQQALASYTPSQLATNPEEIIGGEFGPGQYLVRVILPNVSGKPGNRWGPAKTIVLAEDSLYVRDYLTRHANEPQGRGTDYSADPMFRIMELQIKMAEQRSVDTEKRLAEQNGRFHELILAMIGNNKGGSDISSLITGVKDLKTLADGNGGSSRLTELKELLEIASLLKDGGGGAADESPWLTLGKVVTTGLISQQQQRGAPAPTPAAAALPPASKITVEEKTPAPAAIAGNGDVAGAQTEKPPIGDTPKRDTEKPALIDQLKHKAQHGRDPELWADWTVELADDEENPDAIELIASIGQQPDFGSWWKDRESWNTREWWETYYDRIRETVSANAPAHQTAAAGGAPQ